MQNVNDFCVAAERVPFHTWESVTLRVRELSHVRVFAVPMEQMGFPVTVTIFEGQNSFSTLEKGRNVCSSMHVV